MYISTLNVHITVCHCLFLSVYVVKVYFRSYQTSQKRKTAKHPTNLQQSKPIYDCNLLSLWMSERETAWIKLKKENPLKAFERLHNLKCDRHAKAQLMFGAWMVAAVQSRGPTAWLSQEPDGLHAAPSLQTSARWHVMWSWWHWQRCYWGTAQRQQVPPGKLCSLWTPWGCSAILQSDPSWTGSAELVRKQSPDCGWIGPSCLPWLPE